MTALAMFEVQKALYQAIRTSGSLQAVLGGSESPAENPVYDAQAPDGASLPYLVIGQMLAAPDDTKTEDGMDADLEVHTFSKYLGFKELRQIADALVADIDDTTPAITGGTIWRLTFEGAMDMNDPEDSQIRHGVLRFKVMTQGT